MKIIQITGIILLAFTALFSCNNPAPEKSSSEADERAFREQVDSLLEAHGVQGNYTVKVPKDRFEVTFPVNKKYVENRVNKQILEGEEILTYEYKANMQHKNDVNLAYQLSYNHVGDITTDKEINVLFDEQRDYWISGTNSEIEYERIIDLNGVPGRDLYMTVDGSDVKMSGKMYYYKGVFYRLIVVTADGHLFNKSISKFFKSFHILDKK